MADEPELTHTAADVLLVEERRAVALPDTVAVEEPLEIRLRTGGTSRSVAVTMRTPGADRELAAGFLYSESVVETRADIESLGEGTEARSNARAGYVEARLRAGLDPKLDHLDRHFFASSACGVCGRTDMEAVVLGKITEPQAGPVVDADVLHALPDVLRAGQSVFGATGGLHAAALFTAGGELLAVREDVGRHNALDKLVGWALLDGALPLRDRIVVVSGRASYELVQKCARAEVPILCAVSAPSSLAVSLSRRLGMTLVGFLRDRRFNVYAGAERIVRTREAG